MIEVKEILRLWLAGHSLREVTTLAGADRKTVRRYLRAARDAGLLREGGAGQLSDELLGVVSGWCARIARMGWGRRGGRWPGIGSRSGPGWRRI